jgi:hypothetical protein
LTHGRNRLVGTSAEVIASSVEEILGGRWKSARDVPLWDGRASARIVDVIIGSGRA